VIAEFNSVLPQLSRRGVLFTPIRVDPSVVYGNAIGRME
jgi:hypothetical protein